MPKLHPTDQRPIIRELVIEIEALRQKRQLHWREGNHPENKRFSQEELRDLACPSYKHLLLGNTQRLPSRALILQIADYLECTIHEMNDLLLAAQYLPEVVELPEDQYQCVLEKTKWLLHLLPVPAMLYTRGLEIADANHYALCLNNLSSLDSVEPAKRTAFHWFFDPALPSYQVHAADATTWRHNARNMVDLFYAVHMPFYRERWWHSVVQRAHSLPKFQAIWEEQRTGIESTTHRDVSTTTSPFLSTLIHEQNVSLKIGPTDFPCIFAGIPLDDGAKYTYQQVGCDLSENRWQHALIEGAMHA